MIASFDSLVPAAARPLSTMWRMWRAGRAGMPVIQPRPSPRHHELARHRVVALPAAPGELVECLEGCLWITFDNDARDVVIEAGQSLVVDRSGTGMVQVLDAARIRVTAPEGASPTAR